MSYISAPGTSAATSGRYDSSSRSSTMSAAVRCATPFSRTATAGVPVLLGTCGWTDESLFKCGRFFPRSAKSATERLRHYSRHFPAVEIDTSNYAIPRQQQIREWMSVVPRDFTFHIKVFGLITMRSIAPGALPRDIRADYLTPELEQKQLLKLSELPAGTLDAVWQRMNDALVVLKPQLGVVVFQFQTNFTPTASNFAYVAECRRRLLPDAVMAVEFRSRSWYSTGGVVVAPPETSFPVSDVAPPPGRYSSDAGPTLYASQRAATLYFLRRMAIVNVAADDLAEEFTPNDAAGQPVQPDGRLAIFDDVTSPAAAYIRLHRRQGNDRLLPGAVVDDWVGRLQRMAGVGGIGELQFTPHEASPVSTSSSDAVAASSDVSAAPAPAASSVTNTDFVLASSLHASAPGSAAASAHPLQTSSFSHPWLSTRLSGPIFFMMSTAFEDQVIINAQAIVNALSATPSSSSCSSSTNAYSASQPLNNRAYPLDWKGLVRQSEMQRGSGGLMAFFRPLSSAAGAPSSCASSSSCSSSSVMSSTDPSASIEAAAAAAAAPAAIDTDHAYAASSQIDLQPGSDRKRSRAQLSGDDADAHELQLDRGDAEPVYIDDDDDDGVVVVENTAAAASSTSAAAAGPSSSAVARAKPSSSSKKKSKAAPVTIATYFSAAPSLNSSPQAGRAPSSAAANNYSTPHVGGTRSLGTGSSSMTGSGGAFSHSIGTGAGASSNAGADISLGSSSSSSSGGGSRKSPSKLAQHAHTLFFGKR